MSYDVSIGESSFNYTSNLGPLLYDHIPDMGRGGGIRELDGVTGREAIAILTEFFARVDSARVEFGSDARFSEKYDARNGWGSTLGCLLFMAGILAACANNPRKKVSVCA